MTTNNTATEKAENTSLPLHLTQALELSNNEQTNFPKVRCFYLVDSKVIFGINVLETNDSFLVGAPSRMIKRDESSGIEVESLYKNPIIRILKSSVAIVTMPTKDLLPIYLEFLTSRGKALLPEYMTEDRLHMVNGTIEALTGLTNGAPISVEPMEYEVNENAKRPTHTGSILVH